MFTEEEYGNDEEYVDFESTEWLDTWYDYCQD